MESLFLKKLVTKLFTGEEEERKFSPTLPIVAWQRLLKETGFNGIDVEAHDREDEEIYSTGVMLATADDVHTPQYDANVVLVYGESTPPNDWLARLSEAIEQITSMVPTVEPLYNMDPRGRTCIVLIDIWGDVLTRPSPRQFQAIQGICTRARAVLWLSRGGVMQRPRPEASLHTGLLRTLRCEDNDKRYISLDLDPDLEIPASLSIEAIANVFAASFDNSRDVNHQTSNSLSAMALYIFLEYVRMKQKMQQSWLRRSIPNPKRNLSTRKDGRYAWRLLRLVRLILYRLG